MISKEQYWAPEWDAAKEKYIMKRKSGDGPDQLEFASQQEIKEYFSASDNDADESVSSDLEELANDVEHQDSVNDDEDLEKSVGQIKALDQGKEINECQSKAKKALESIYKLYFSQKIIDENEYLRIRKGIDQYNLENLMFQLVINRHALQTLVEQIDSGNIHPRTYEVFAQLQKTNLEILRSQTVHLMSMEENVKKMKDEIPDLMLNQTEEESKELGNEDLETERGQRAYMKKLQERVNNEENSGSSNEENNE